MNYELGEPIVQDLWRSHKNWLDYHMYQCVDDNLGSSPYLQTWGQLLSDLIVSLRHSLYDGLWETLYDLQAG